MIRFGRPGRQAYLGMMMKYLVIFVGGAVVLIAAFALWRYYAAAGEDRSNEWAEEVAPVADALAAGRIPSSSDLDRFASDRITREPLFRVLDHHKRLELFPTRHRTWEAVAEGQMVTWLRFPTELNAPPDEIELMKRVPMPDAPPGDILEYFVFRFRTRPPHWAAQKGWLAGIAGPYPTGRDPVFNGAGTFSRFEAYDLRSPEEHVRTIQETVTAIPR